MKEWLVVLAVLHGADTALTSACLAQGGCREANPFLPQGPVANAVVKGLYAAGSIWALDRLSVSHPRLAKTLTSVAIGLEGVAVGQGVRVVVRVK